MRQEEGEIIKQGGFRLRLPGVASPRGCPHTRLVATLDGTYVHIKDHSTTKATLQDKHIQ
jgi:hypothetical protein